MKKVIRINEDEPLDSPRKAIQKVVREILSPAVDSDLATAIKNKRQKRKRVQAEAGEVLTETAVERMRQEEVERQAVTKTKGKAPKGKVAKPKSRATHTIEDPDIAQSSRIDDDDDESVPKEAPKPGKHRRTISLKSRINKAPVEDGEEPTEPPAQSASGIAVAAKATKNAPKGKIAYVLRDTIDDALLQRPEN